MRANSLRRLGWVCGLACAIAGAVAGCGGETDAPDGPIGGSESHFLAYCEETCGDGLACITGVCTRGCVVSGGGCDDLAPNAVCTAESIEPGAVAVCDVSCESHEDCSVISAEHTCDEGYCRKSADPGDGGTTNDGACDVGGTLVPSGGVVPNPDGCGYCTCDAGELACDDGCPEVIEVPRCPEGELTGDPIGVEFYHPEGDVFVVGVTHGGGCEEHTYAMCYRPKLVLSYPPYADLLLTHDAHGDLCDAALSGTVRFDLSELIAEFGSDEVVFEPPKGVAGGAVAFGVTQVLGGCEGRTTAARDQTDSLVEAIRTCKQASDCLQVPTSTSCNPTCGALVNGIYAEQLASALESIELSVCGDCEAPPALCLEPGAADCIDGVCVIASP